MKDSPSKAGWQDSGLRKKNAWDLHSPGLLARQPLIGLMMVLMGGLAFGAIAYSLQTDGPLVQWDVPLANTIHQAALQSSPVIKGLMIFGFYLGEHVIAAIGGLLAIYFLRKRYFTELYMVILAWAGEGLLWMILSQTFGRSRPVFDVQVFHQMTSPGFPSGHAISAVMCYGLLAYLLLPKISRPFWKAALVAGMLLAVLLIGYSRIFMGDHYLSDVLAGYALGIAWSGLVYTGIEMIYIKRKNQNV